MALLTYRLVEFKIHSAFNKRVGRICNVIILGEKKGHGGEERSWGGRKVMGTGMERLRGRERLAKGE